MQREKTIHTFSFYVAIKSMSRYAIVGLVSTIMLVLVSGCEQHDPERNTATSGRLLVLVDEMYEPLIRELADTFMSRTPARTITVEPVLARTGVQELINRRLSDTALTDTSTRFAIVLGRELLEDEYSAIKERGLEESLIEIGIGYDGLAIAVPTTSRLQETTRERLQTSLNKKDRSANDLEDGKGSDVLRFIFTDPNSSAYNFVRSSLLQDGEPTGPTQYYRTSDSVIEAVANGEGITLMGWYRAHRDSGRIRTLKLGYTDSLGIVYPPVPVHTATLVMNKYPLKLPLVGYTFAGVNSLANGFLTWLALGQDAQEGLANRGIEPKNLRFRFLTE